MKKREALEVLEKEHRYEDSIVEDISVTYLAALKKITDINDKERKELDKKLSKIREDSKKHSLIFEKLIEFVNKNGTDNY
ncbi:MAG: hypothetical protein WC867_07505 [Candidatus Pacearchaeota archaeon]|jgi:hypothetical protein